MAAMSVAAIARVRNMRGLYGARHPRLCVSASRDGNNRHTDDERRNEFERQLFDDEADRPRLLGVPDQPQRRLSGEKADQAKRDALRRRAALELEPAKYPDKRCHSR